MSYLSLQPKLLTKIPNHINKEINKLVKVATRNSTKDASVYTHRAFVAKDGNDFICSMYTLGEKSTINFKESQNNTVKLSINNRTGEILEQSIEILKSNGESIIKKIALVSKDNVFLNYFIKFKNNKALKNENQKPFFLKSNEIEEKLSSALNYLKSNLLHPKKVEQNEMNVELFNEKTLFTALKKYDEWKHQNPHVYEELSERFGIKI